MQQYHISDVWTDLYLFIYLFLHHIVRREARHFLYCTASIAPPVQFWICVTFYLQRPVIISLPYILCLIISWIHFNICICLHLPWCLCMCLHIAVIISPVWIINGSYSKPFYSPAAHIAVVDSLKVGKTNIFSKATATRWSSFHLMSMLLSLLFMPAIKF